MKKKKEKSTWNDDNTSDGSVDQDVHVSNLVLLRIKSNFASCYVQKSNKDSITPSDNGHMDPNSDVNILIMLQ